MRIFSQKKADRSYIFKRFPDMTNLRYMIKIPEERENMLKNYYMKKRSFNETCQRNMSDYDNIALTICSSADAFEKILGKNQVAKLKAVCAQGFCNAKTNYPFCSKVSGLNDDDSNSIIKMIIKITIVTIVLSLVMWFAFVHLYQKK